MLVLAKSPALYRTRLTASLGLLALGIGFAILYENAGLRALGPVVESLAFILFIICMFAGVQLTSDSIAREKRDGTLGLLFLTPLIPFQIVIGKLVAHGLMGFYWVLITVPLLSILLIVGGIEGSTLFVLALAGLNTVFFSGAVGLFVSTLLTKRKKAGAAGTWVIMFFWWGVPLLIAAVQGPNFYKAPPWLIEVMNLFVINGIFSSLFAGPQVRVIPSPWLNILATHLMAWGFVGLAAYYLRRRWQDHPPAAKMNFRERWKQRSLGKPAVRLRLRRQLLDRNPFLWLASRERLRPFWLWVITVLSLIFITFMIPAGADAIGLIAGLTLALSILHKALLASSAGHQLIVEQEQGTLEMLLSTPLAAQEVLRGQLNAVLRQFRGPVALAFLLQLGGAVFLLLVPELGASLGKSAIVAAGMAVNALIYLLDLYALLWVGMWSAMIVRDPKSAGGNAIARVIVLPCLVFALVVTASSFVSWYWRVPALFPAWLLVPFWFALGIVNDIGWLIYVRRHLPSQLRTFSLKRYSPEEKRSFLQILFGQKNQNTTAPPLLSELPAGNRK